MLLVSVSRLTPGMVTAAPVLHPRRSSIHLVEANVELRPDFVARLAELKVPHVWIKHPLLADLDTAILSHVPEHRRAIYDSIKVGFDQLQNRVITTQDYRHYRDVVADLIDELVGQSGIAGNLAERLFHDGDELVSHSANVAYLAVAVGLHLESYVVRQRGKVSGRWAYDLTSLGVGAMLHDIGKLNGPAKARVQHETTRPRHGDYPRHVLDGFNVLRRRVGAVAGAVALHHHQRWDGAGWPDMKTLSHGRVTGGLHGRKIHVFPRIVAAVNAFDCLTAPSPDVRMPPVYALHAMPKAGSPRLRPRRAGRPAAPCAGLPHRHQGHPQRRPAGGGDATEPQPALPPQGPPPGRQLRRRRHRPGTHPARLVHPRVPGTRRDGVAVRPAGAEGSRTGRRGGSRRKVRGGFSICDFRFSI